MVDVEFAVETGVDDEGMGHGYSFGFHGVLFRVDEFAEVLVVEIAHPPFAFRLHHLIFIANMGNKKESKYGRGNNEDSFRVK